MKFVLAFTLLLAAASPAVAQEEAPEVPDKTPEWAIVDEDPIFDAVDAFLAAIGSDHKSDLADHMLPDGTIFVHNLMDPQNPRVDVVSNAKHLENWAKRGGIFEEAMEEYKLSVSWTMAHAWGWYTFKVDGKVSHCGVNSLSLVRMDDGRWKVGNASFTMVPPDECQRRADIDALANPINEESN